MIFRQLDIANKVLLKIKAFFKRKCNHHWVEFESSYVDDFGFICLNCDKLKVIKVSDHIAISEPSRQNNHDNVIYVNFGK